MIHFSSIKYLSRLCVIHKKPDHLLVIWAREGAVSRPLPAIQKRLWGALVTWNETNRSRRTGAWHIYERVAQQFVQQFVQAGQAGRAAATLFAVNCVLVVVFLSCYFSNDFQMVKSYC